MNPIVITYGGIVVAALIIAWGFFEMGKRFFIRKRSAGKNEALWVTMKPMRERTLTEEERREGSAPSETPRRAQQNGHYSESNKKL